MSFAKLSLRGLCPDCGKKRQQAVRRCNRCQRQPSAKTSFSTLSRRGLCPDCGKQRQQQSGLDANHSQAGKTSGKKRTHLADEDDRAIKRLQSQTLVVQRAKRAAEVFSGSGMLSQHLRRLGWTAEEWDFRHGTHMDLTRIVCQNVFLAKMRAGQFAFLWFGTCCKTFSRATAQGPGPQPVRSNDHVWGFPDLTGRRLEKTQLANKLARFTLKAIRLATRLNLHWAVENPLGSMLWMLPGFVSLRGNSKDHVFVRVDYCQYGTNWQKPTAILSNCHSMAEVGAQCRMTICESSHTRRICSSSGKCHVKLRGKDDEGHWKTSHAEAYPLRLCKRIAQILDKAL